MSKKAKHPDLPVVLCGRIVLEFFGNDDDSFKTRTLEKLSKEVRKEFNVSCLPVEESWMENPERGTLALSICVSRTEKSKESLERVLKYIDENAPARVVLEDFEEVAISLAD